MAYRSTLLYRNPGHYRVGVFDLQYRNVNQYRNNYQYRLGIDDPIVETATGVDAETLVVTIALTDSGSAVDVLVPMIGVYPVWLNNDFAEGLEAGHGVSFILADTGSSTSTELAGIAIYSSDNINYWYGSQQAYRNDLDYRTEKAYRGVGAHPNIEQAVQADTGSGSDVTVSFDNAITVTEAIAFLEAHGIDLSQADTSAGADVYVSLILISEELAEGTDLVIGGDRTFVGYGDDMGITDTHSNLTGDPSEHFSYLAVNRYRATPSRFKVR